VQALQPVAPAELTNPAAQDGQATLPLLALNVPARQLVQEREPRSVFILPAGHCRHVLGCVESPYEPALHGVQAMAPGDAANVPVPQAVHSADPSRGLK
jgi:hypothetical protein